MRSVTVTFGGAFSSGAGLKGGVNVFASVYASIAALLESNTKPVPSSTVYPFNAKIAASATSARITNVVIESDSVAFAIGLNDALRSVVSFVNGKNGIL